MQDVGGVLGHAQRPEVRQMDVHLRGRLGTRRELELHVDTIDGEFLAGRRDLDRGRDQRHGAGRRRQAEAGADLTTRTALQRRAVHVAGAPRHRSPGEHVLGHGVPGESGGGDDRHRAGVHVCLVHHAPHAAEVVDVAMGVEHPGDGAVPAMLAVEGERGGGCLHRDQRVDNHHAGITLDEGDLREVEPAHLVQARHHLVEPLERAQLRLPPEARVDGVRSSAGQESVGVDVPHHPARAVPHHAGLQGGDEAPPGVLEVLSVGEG